MATLMRDPSQEEMGEVIEWVKGRLA
jgi:hypothetical protein